MFRSIVIAGILALAFGVSACGSDPAEPAKAAAVKSTPTPVATPDPKIKQAALLTEATTVIDRLLTLNNRVGNNTSDPDRVCNYILPQMNAKMDHLDDLMEKLDEAGMSVKDIGELRGDFSGLAGAVGTMEEVCSSYGY